MRTDKWTTKFITGGLNTILYYRNSGKLRFGLEWRFNRKLINRRFIKNYGLAFRLLLGDGAGCKNGLTFYFAINPNSYRWSCQYRNGVLSNGKKPNFFTRLTKVFCGITRNANIVPYMSV